MSGIFWTNRIGILVVDKLDESSTYHPDNWKSILQNFTSMNLDHAPTFIFDCYIQTGGERLVLVGVTSSNIEYP